MTGLHDILGSHGDRYEDAGFCDVALYSPLMMMTVSSSETSVNLADYMAQRPRRQPSSLTTDYMTSF
jgi:hypothetical protein